MIPGCWRSVPYDGDMADVESMVAEHGLAMVWSVKEWYTHRGHKVDVGKHTVADDPRKIATMMGDLRKLVRSTNGAPDARHINVLVDRCHT